MGRPPQTAGAGDSGREGSQTYQVQVQVTADMAIMSARSYLLPLVRIWLILGVINLAAAGAFTILGLWQMGLVFGGMASVGLLIRWRALRKSARKNRLLFAMQGERQVTWTFSETGADVTTIRKSTELSDKPDAYARLRWDDFYRLIQRRDFWLLFILPEYFHILPADELSPELRAFIVEKLRQSNRRVIRG